MRQIVAIHGGDSFATYEEYLEALKSNEVTLEKFLPRAKDWKHSLQDTLGQEWQVFLPNMPNANNARFEEWKIWFEKLLVLLDDNVILIGHSLGGVFLASYLSRVVIPKKVLATFLVGAPFGEGDLKLPDDLTKMTEQAGKIVIFHSEDDPVVPFEECKKYQQALPSASIVSFTDRGHFIQEQFPELVEALTLL